ncbi:MAG: hypothetical protein NTV99_00800 [Deltaproteobacteria bacterium]|nr:hypothetical protein [Deltaproteobacteria bacterium]
MEHTKIAKQTMDFYKTTFDNTYGTLMALQAQTQQLISTQMEQTAGLPAEGKQLVNEWMKSYRRGCEDFKKVVDDGFVKFESYFGAAEKNA